MNQFELMHLLVGTALGLGLPPFLFGLFRLFTLTVEDEEAVLLTRFGRLTGTLRRPGLHWMPACVLPWVKVHHVSLRRDFREFNGIHINDARGTSVMIDLWLEFRISDPARALFDVADWDASLQNLVSHSAISILGNRDFSQILTDRSELGELLQREVHAETSRWGLEVDQVLIRNVRLLPEVSRRMLGTIAARLELAKAQIEEEGRQAVSLLEAETSARVAGLVADAKGQYPAAVGRALEALAREPAVLAAYQELYSLSQVRPHRTVAFSGFDSDGLRAVDAAMLPLTGAQATAEEVGSGKVRSV